MLPAVEPMGDPAYNVHQGDFNLAVLDLLEANGLYWVGNCNELNAGL